MRFDIEKVTEMHEQFLKQGKLPTNKLIKRYYK